MNFLYSVIIFIGTLFGSINSLPIYQPFQNDGNPLVLQPVHKSASGYIIHVNPAIIPPPSPPPYGPILYDEQKTNDEIIKNIQLSFIPPPPRPILYEPLEIIEPGPVLIAPAQNQ